MKKKKTKYGYNTVIGILDILLAKLETSLESCYFLASSEKKKCQDQFPLHIFRHWNSQNSFQNSSFLEENLNILNQDWVKPLIFYILLFLGSSALQSKAA